ncbi:MAG: CPBP family intramembrane metalloprotease, partial [Candidatus Omnitrophica bacterium]|nr:CPBP family intramembrane metalloprotease [Candidatus Omnitrophota bacterium]
MLNFIRRERIYILIVIFVLAVNFMHMGQAKSQIAPKQEKSLSSMSFEEIGVTEKKVKTFLESKTPSAIFFRYSISLGFLVFALFLILNAGFILRKKPFAPIPLPGREKRDVAWGILDIGRVALIILFISYAVGITEGFVIRALGINIDLNLRMIIGTFFVDIFAVAALLYFVMRGYREKPASLGLKFFSFFRNVLTGITAYVFIVPLLLVILILSVWLLNVFGYQPPPQPVFEAFISEKNSRVLFFLTIFVSVLGPIAEEVFFRGFMYSAIKKRLGVLSAAFLSAVVFSLLHANIAGFLPIMALGVLLAYLYEATGSLVASMTVHVIHNSV